MHYAPKFAFVATALLCSCIASFAYAQSATTTPAQPVIFPIVELGNCASKQECKVYCDTPLNKDACLSYAQSHGLMTKAKVDAARLLIKKQGPGGCESREACRAYCADEAHRQECFAFAVKNGLRSEEEAQRDQSFQSVLKTTGGPGGCTETSECKAYCSDAAHATECREFAQLHGFMRLRQQVGPMGELGSTSRKLSTTSPRNFPPKHFMSSTTKERPSTSSPKFFEQRMPPNFNKPTPPPRPQKDPTTNTESPSSFAPRGMLSAAVAQFIGFFSW